MDLTDTPGDRVVRGLGSTLRLRSCGDPVWLGAHFGDGPRPSGAPRRPQTLRGVSQPRGALAFYARLSAGSP